MKDERSAVEILVVDDEPFILTSIKRALRKHPWTVHTAGSGRQGLEVLSERPIQVVISDYQMTGMDGIEFLNQVKDRWPRIQRVMLTGQADAEAVEKAVNQAEVYRFINKPWHESQLVGTIHECIDQQQLIESNLQYEKELAQRNEELLAINRDLEKLVQERTRALVQAEKMGALGRMSGGVAHEINNPLGGILAFAQVLLRDKDSYDSQTREALETIQTCALRCKAIVDNLLSFSRKPAGDEYNQVDINQVAEDGLAIARLDLKSRDLSVQKEFFSGIAPIRGQAALLEQVVVNLLQNAFHASPSRAQVVLRTRPDGDTVVLEVEDRGEGISEEALPQIFEPFFTTKEPGQGTGLGLAICYGIVSEHGGRLTASNNEDRGATLAMRLPAASNSNRKEQES